MCFRHNWIDEKCGFMSDEVIEKLISDMSEFNELETVVIAGIGEPLLHKSVFDIIGKCKNLGLCVEIITNAMLLTKENAQKLCEAQTDRIWISMDGFSKEDYEKVQRKGEYETLIENIEYFNSIKNDSRLALTFVILNDNIDQLMYINRFANKYDIDMLNISHAIPIEPIERNLTLFDDPDFIIGKTHRYGSPSDFKPICPFIDSEVCFVRWDGDVAPCMQLLHDTYTYLFEQKRRIHRISFGNIMEENLKAIYDNKDFIKLRNMICDEDFPKCVYCEGCELREENKQDCMFNTFPTCGACLWSTGKIRCP